MFCIKHQIAECVPLSLVHDLMIDSCMKTLELDFEEDDTASAPDQNRADVPQFSESCSGWLSSRKALFLILWNSCKTIPISDLTCLQALPEQYFFVVRGFCRRLLVFLSLLSGRLMPDAWCTGDWRKPPYHLLMRTTEAVPTFMTNI